MPELDPPNLFAAAGLVLEGDASPKKPKRSRKPKPSPAALAASGRLAGARRSRPAPRDRVGPARQLGAGQLVPFPLARNVAAVAEVYERLPHGYSDTLDRCRNQEVTRLQKSLIAKGIPKQSAWQCARELVHVAYIKRVTQAHKEAGIL